MSTTFGERLLEALSARSISRADLARVLRGPDGKMGISQSAVGQVIRGESNAMSAENTLRAARHLKVSAFWLATGEGRMDEPEPVLVRAPEPPPYTDFDVVRRMGQLLARVDDDLRGAVGDVLAGWARNGGDEGRQGVLLDLLSRKTKQRAA